MTFFRKDEQLEKLGDRILETTWGQFPGLARNQIALTWIVYDPPIPVNTGGSLSPVEFWKHQVRGFSYRGVERIYPASIVKLFYLVAIYEWLDKNMVRATPELERAIRDAIAADSNNATSLLVDVLTGTNSGPELPPGPFETWKFQRNIVNRYFQSLDWSEFEGININQKTWSEGAYGRDRAFMGEMMENRNMLTANATARLLHGIVGGIAVSSQASQAIMQAIMLRDRENRSATAKEQSLSSGDELRGFLGSGLPHNSKIWAFPGKNRGLRAELTDQVRHDCAYIEITDRIPYILVVFTEGPACSKSKAILPFVSQQVAEVMDSLT